MNYPAWSRSPVCKTCAYHSGEWPCRAQHQSEDPRVCLDYSRVKPVSAREVDQWGEPIKEEARK